MTEKRILFVDDEQNILDGMRRMLRSSRKGLNISYAINANDALQQMAEKPFDIVVSDMRMPGMDGAQLLCEIRERYPETIRIMLTGQADNGSVLRTVNVAHQFLAKPCTPEQLKTTLHQACLLHAVLYHHDIRQVVARIDKLPSLPALYQQVRKMVADPLASVEDVAKCISQDISMSAKVLQLVNSAFFGLFKRVESPAQAVHLLGLDTIQSLVLSVQVFSQFEDQDFSALSLEGLWRHCLATGVYAKKIASSMTKEKAVIDDAFIAGLQHDIGRLILVANLPERYNKALELAEEKSIPLHLAEYTIFGASHAEVGAYLLGLWGFSGPVIEAVAYHHGPCRYPGETFDAVTAVHAANVIETEISGGLSGSGVLVFDMEFMARVGCSNYIPRWRESCQADLGKKDE